MIYHYRIKVVYFVLGLLSILGGLAGCDALANTFVKPLPTETSIALTDTPSLMITLRIVSDTPFATNTVNPTPTVRPSDTPANLPEPTPTEGCSSQQGQIVPQQITSEAMGHPLEFNIYLPPCYDTRVIGGYPVLYMLHGQTFNQDQWIRLGLTAEADQLITSGDILPFIIVMPYEKDTWANPFTSGFEPALTDELIPWIDQNYNTCALRQCRAIGGLSRGGAWAIHLGFVEWKLFGAIGGHSPVPFEGDTPHLVSWQAKIPAGELPQIYLDMGQNDPFLQYSEEFNDQLVKLGIPHEWLIQPGNHAEAYWQSHVIDYLRWYASFFKSQRDKSG